MAAAVSAAPAAAVDLRSFALGPRCLPSAGREAAALRLRVDLSGAARLSIRLQRRLDSPARVLCPHGPPRRPFVPGRFGRTQTFVVSVPAGTSTVVLPVVRRRTEARVALAPRLGPVHLVPGTYRVRLVARDEAGASQVLLRDFIVLRSRR